MILYPPNNDPDYTDPLDYVSSPWTDPNGGKWLWNDTKQRWASFIEPPAAGASTYADLTDAATVDLPAVNTPLSTALGLKLNADDVSVTNARTPTAHTHDDRYFTESEVTALIPTRASLDIATTDSVTFGTVAATTFTGSLTGNATTSSSTTGNAATATSLATARDINGVSFNGTASITVTAAAGTLTGTSLNSAITTASGLTTAAGGDFGTAAFSATTAFAPSRESVTAGAATAKQAVAGARYIVTGSGLAVMLDPTTGLATGQSYTVIVGGGSVRWADSAATTTVVSGSVYVVVSGTDHPGAGSTVAGTVYTANATRAITTSTVKLVSGTSYLPSRFEVIRYYNGTIWSTLAPTVSDTLNVGPTGAWDGTTFSGNAILASAQGTPSTNTLMTMGLSDARYFKKLIARKTSAEGRNNLGSVSKYVDSQLFLVLPPGTYRMQVMVNWRCATNGTYGISCAGVFNGGSVGQMYGVNERQGSANVMTGYNYPGYYGGNYWGSQDLAGSASFVRSDFIVTVTTQTTAEIRWAQLTSDPNNTFVDIGSYIIAELLP